ncbi:MAG: hypothetical protein ABIX01_01580 [Chitinophagaceae bacterium]
MFKRTFFFAFVLTAFSVTAQPSKISKSDLKYLVNVDDTLSALADKVLDDIDVISRVRSDSMLTRSLVRALKTPYSFFYGFDSTQTLTISYPPDSSFRILTWQFEINEQVYRQKGAIQMNTADGSLLLHPLFDASEYAEFPNDSVRGASNWIGAIYYKVLQNSYNGQQFYTLLGFDENGYRSTKKWVEVLHFDENKQPVFGGDYFVFDKRDSLFQPGSKRFSIEFKKEGRARLNYDTDKEIIMFDHLISEENEPEKKYTYIPDGDYEGLQWKDGKWVHIPKVFTESLVDGKEPNPDLLMDDNGTINEGKLNAQSEKNANKKIEVGPIKKKSTIVLPSTKRKGGL